MGGASTEEMVLTDTKKKRKDCFNRGSVDVFVREVCERVFILYLNDGNVCDKRDFCYFYACHLCLICDREKNKN